MIDWHQGELELLRRVWPDLKYEPDGHWILFENFALPDGWDRKKVDIALQIPATLPGQEPYAFWTKGDLCLETGGVRGNYSFPSSDNIPFTSDNLWGKFSWGLNGWAPGSAPGEGTGMVHFVYSINARLRELN
jgi:hypothetical protein